MKYFIPEWDDKVDPHYDFVNDEHSETHYNNGDVYLWDIFGYDNVPIDGILLSRVKALTNKKKYQALLEDGVHQYYRFPGEFIGDCGAFGYINEEVPPFKTKDTFEYYLKAGFNYGVSIDHLIVKSIRTEDGKKRTLTPQEKKNRWQKTLENAHEMYELWQSKDAYKSNIRIIGAIQGWDVDSYREATRNLLQIGYDYIGVGGLVRKPTQQIVRIMTGIGYEIRKFVETTKKKIDMHAFGVARPKILPKLFSFGLTSFDSAVFLRNAWMSSEKNYLLSQESGYTAIRVRDPERIKELSANEIESLKKSEEKLLKLLRDYDKENVSLSKVEELLEQYEKNTNGIVPILKYTRTLEEQVWKKCGCPICSDVSIEVAIFRGNNRNRRRGFHNTHIFYKWFREAIPRILIVTNCTAKKQQNEALLPAFIRYGGSPVFKAFWNQVYDLPVEIKILSAKYGLIDCTDYIPDYNKKMTENDVPIYVDELKEKLQSYDKIFFIGLGLYRKIIEQVKDETKYDIDIFPKATLTDRNRLDIIEYTKQVKFFRKAVLDKMPQECRPPTVEELGMELREGLEKFFVK